MIFRMVLQILYGGQSGSGGGDLMEFCPGDSHIVQDSHIMQDSSALQFF